jgi:hypothetical protein
LEKGLRILGLDGDEEGNFMVIKVETTQGVFTLGSVYGPNHDEQANTYETLSRLIRKNRADKIIIGGDFNATWDNNRVNSNVDVFNMVDIPSRVRTGKIRDLAEEFQLVDAFRTLNPNKKEYTYIPSAINNRNRSRLDFFLISSNIINAIDQCEIPHSLASTLFDHKQISLRLGKSQKQIRYLIKDSILKDSATQIHVQVGIIETYVQHGVINDDFTQQIKDALLLRVGRINANLNRIHEMEMNMALNGFTEQESLIIAGLRADVRLEMEDFPMLEYFENLTKNCNDAIFFEALTSWVPGWNVPQLNVP